MKNKNENLYLEINSYNTVKCESYIEGLDYLEINNSILNGNCVELRFKNDNNSKSDNKSCDSNKNKLIGSFIIINLSDNVKYLNEFYIKKEFRNQGFG